MCLWVSVVCASVVCVCVCPPLFFYALNKIIMKVHTNKRLIVCLVAYAVKAKRYIKAIYKKEFCICFIVNKRC